ncbi:MAG TPA: hypothetical protein ENK33_03690 [Desulfobacterales bacterium]|nr:hypothetical protein [Desulfobacterales bacterium]
MKKLKVGGGLLPGCKKIYTTLAVCLIIITVGQGVKAAETTQAPSAQQQFLDAMKKRAEDKLYDAAAGFNNILTNHPLLQRARLELAVTYYRLYDYAKAQKLAQKVLDDPKTPPNVRVTVLAFMAQIKRDAQGMKPGHTWKPSIAIGWMHDSNINVGPSSNVINIGNTQLQVSPGSLPISDDATILSANLAHRYETGKTVRFGQKNASFLWQDNLSLYRRDYYSENVDDLDVISFSTGPAFVAMKDWRANLAAQVSYIRLGNRDLAWFTSLLPSYTKQFANGAYQLSLDGDYTFRIYKRDQDKGRNSNYLSGQLSIGRTFVRARVGLLAGVRLFRETADDTIYTDTGRDFYASISWRAWTNGALYGRINDTHYSYDGKEALINLSRQERTRKYTLGISHTFRYKWLNGWGLSGNYVRTENNSNIDLYEYTREQSSVMLSKAF